MGWSYVYDGYITPPDEAIGTPVFFDGVQVPQPPHAGTAGLLGGSNSLAGLLCGLLAAGLSLGGRVLTRRA